MPPEDDWRCSYQAAHRHSGCAPSLGSTALRAPCTLVPTGVLEGISMPAHKDDTCVALVPGVRRIASFRLAAYVNGHVSGRATGEGA